MQVIETISVEQAAAALGLRPAAVRLRIKSGALAAALVGRKFRVGTASVNALLAGAGPASRPTPRPASGYDSSFPQPSACPAVQRAVPPVAQVVVQPLPTTSPFDDNDMAWITAYRRQLADPNPAVRSNAKFHLERFAARAADDPTRGPAPTPDQLQATCEAVKANWCAKPAGSDVQW